MKRNSSCLLPLPQQDGGDQKGAQRKEQIDTCGARLGNRSPQPWQRHMQMAIERRLIGQRMTNEYAQKRVEPQSVKFGLIEAMLRSASRPCRCTQDSSQLPHLMRAPSSLGKGVPVLFL